MPLKLVDILVDLCWPENLLGPILPRWCALSGAGPLADRPLAALFSFFFSDLFTRTLRPSSLLPSSLSASWTASAL